MQKLDALYSHISKLNKGNELPKALYVIVSDEPLLIMEAQDALRAALKEKGYTERDTLLNEKGFDWATLINSTQSMSLFGDKRFIELRIPTGKPGREGADVLKQFAADVANQTGEPGAVTCIILPKLDSATQKGAWFTAIEDAGLAVRIDSIERHLLPAWINERLKRQNQHIANDEPGKRAMAFLVSQIEGNLIAAHQEIQKLGLLYPEGALTEEQIQHSVLNVARYDVFQLTEAYLAGDMLRVNRMLDGLKGEGEPIALVAWTVIEEIRLLSELKREVMSGNNLQTLFRSRRVWGKREQLIPQALNRLSLPMLDRALEMATQLDKQVKGWKIAELPTDPWDSLRRIGGVFCFR